MGTNGRSDNITASAMELIFKSTPHPMLTNNKFEVFIEAVVLWLFLFETKCSRFAGALGLFHQLFAITLVVM